MIRSLVAAALVLLVAATAMADIRRRASEARWAKGPFWWNPYPEA